MTKRIAISVLLVCILASPVLAQVAFNTGSIYGKTFDPNGAGLPGVTVTVEAEGMAPRTVTTGPGGGYRFAALQPGIYSLTFSLQGFTEVRQEDVRLNAGQNINLEVTLKQTTEEVVVVSGAEPIVDTKKTSTSSNYTQDYLKSVPSGRDPWVILDQTPGIDVDRVNVGGSQSGQQSVYTARGGSFAQNGWSYDGVDITDPAASGSTPTYYDFDSFQEIQVTTGGQDPAIATGGVVINFITKRGGNTWAGQGSGYFDNDNLESDNLDSTLVGQHFVEPNAVDQIYEYGGDISGPIVKDKAWIWGAYRKQDIKTHTAGVELHDQTNPANNGVISGLAPQHIVLEDVNLKANIAYNNANEGSFQFLYGNKDFAGRFALPPNNQAPDSLWNQSGPTKLYKASHSWIPNANLFLDAKFAYIDSGFLLDPINGRGLDNQPVFRLVGGLFLEHGYVFYDTKRPQYDFSEDTNYFKQNWMGGDHEFKFGFAYKQASVTTSCQYSGDIVLYDLTGQPFDRSANFGIAKLRELVNANFDINSWGVYGGDTWRMNKLTINLGLRFDHSDTKAKAADAPANAIAPDIVPALHFPGQGGPTFSNVSPRIGGTFDLEGNGRTVIRGNYARFYDGVGPFPSNFINPLGERGDYTGVYVLYYDANGDGTVTRDELLDSIYGFAGTIGGFCVGDPECTLANNKATRVIDGNFDSEVTNEYLAGIERQIGSNMSIGANFVYRKYDNLQDTYRPGVTSLDFQCAPLTVTNPLTGESFTNQTFCDLPEVIDAFVLLNTENRNRTYRGFELTLNKRMADNWMFRANAEFKDQKIHFGDDGTQFGGSFQDPTNIPFTNDTWWAEQSTGSGAGGVYTGARWSLKLSGAYQFPYDLTVGAYLKVVDGNVVPIIRRLDFQNYTNGAFNVLLAPFDAERLDTLKYMDLRVDKGFAMGSYGKLSVSMDVFNLFNANTSLRIERRVNSVQFREAQEIISPRIVRFGLRYNF